MKYVIATNNPFERLVIRIDKPSSYVIGRVWRQYDDGAERYGSWQSELIATKTIIAQPSEFRAVRAIIRDFEGADQK